jgi:hypothetical protein
MLNVNREVLSTSTIKHLNVEGFDTSGIQFFPYEKLKNHSKSCFWPFKNWLFLALKRPLIFNKILDKNSFRTGKVLMSKN